MPFFVKEKILATTHSGIKTEFHRNFIKTSIFSVETGKLYSNLFDKRQEGDYFDFHYFKESDIQPLIEEAEEFIFKIENYIKGESELSANQ